MTPLPNNADHPLYAMIRFVLGSIIAGAVATIILWKSDEIDAGVTQLGLLAGIVVNLFLTIRNGSQQRQIHRETTEQSKSLQRIENVTQSVLSQSSLGEK